MNTHLVRQLTYAGVIPFLLCTLVLGLNIQLPVPESVFETVLMSYTLAIVSFLCGAQWGLALVVPEKTPFNLFVLSNALTLIVWACFLMSCAGLFYLCSALVFAVLLWVDARLFQRSVISRAYYQIRRQITTIVVACLLIVFLF
jgi:hypothetical protein